MKSIVILQARTNSSRLPAKVLLPIKGTPVVVLAAKRAANTGKKVIVATSEEGSDDLLVNTLESHNIEYFRGSLKNVLSRFVKAIEGLQDNTIVFRLTADNVFPDGQLIDEIEESFMQSGAPYLCCNSIESGLPYGVSVEVMHLSLLRQANDRAKNEYDLEHVTPYIIRKYGKLFFKKYYSLNKSYLRCTIDCLEDYLLINKVFIDVENPISVDCTQLVNILDKKSNFFFDIDKKIRPPKMILGGAQLGLNYGISNESGQPSFEESSLIIDSAISHGLEYIDTARVYGNSEEVIGDVISNGLQGRIKIITKLSPLVNIIETASEEAVRANVRSDVYQSCRNLRVKTLDVLMLHRANQLESWNGVVFDELKKLVKIGVIRKLGASVQSPDELGLALKFNELSFIQIPYNILDWRWDSLVEKIKEIKERRELVIHVRSVLLQGLLVSTNVEHWKLAHVKKPDDIIKWLEQKTSEYMVKDISQLCMKFVNSLDWIDGIVIGNDNMKQLKMNIMSSCIPLLSRDEISELLSNRPSVSKKTLNPAMWNKLI